MPAAVNRSQIAGIVASLSTEVVVVRSVCAECRKKRLGKVGAIIAAK